MVHTRNEKKKTKKQKTINVDIQINNNIQKRLSYWKR